MDVKLESIKYNTDTDDFMDVDKITSLTENYVDGEYVTDMNETINTLNVQMTSGGLLPYVFIFI